jgi:hypothetical protein
MQQLGMLTVLIRSGAAVTPCLVVTMTLLAGCSTSHSPAVESSTAHSRATNVFGNELSLTGYDIRSKDSHTEMELRWSAVRNPTADYVIFVHGVDGSGAIAFQADHELKDDAGVRTAAWKVGESVKDHFLLTPPPGHAAGKYAIRLGAYIPSPMKLLSVINPTINQPTDAWHDHSVIIDQVECK